MRSTNTSANKIVDSAEKSNSRNTPKRINFLGGTKTFTKIVKRDHLKSQIIFEEMKREPLKIAPSKIKRQKVVKQLHPSASAANSF
jgi:hypothetical protein